MDDLSAELVSLKSMIKTEEDDTVLLEDLKKYTYRYRMDIESAKRAIIKDHGGTDADYVGPELEPKRIIDLSAGDNNVTVVARVSSVVRKQVNVRGTPTILHELLLEDDSGEVVLTLWEEELEIEVGRTYRFRGCKGDYFRGEMSLKMSRSGSFSLEDGVKFKTAEEKLRETSIKISEIEGVCSDITLIGTVQNIVERPYVDRMGQQKLRYNGVIHDKTGSMDFVVWSDPGVKDGDRVCMKGVSVQEFRGELSINVGRGKIILL